MADYQDSVDSRKPMAYTKSMCNSAILLGYYYFWYESLHPGLALSL